MEEGSWGELGEDMCGERKRIEGGGCGGFYGHLVMGAFNSGIAVGNEFDMSVCRKN